MACDPFTVEFSGSSDELFKRMQETANMKHCTLTINTTTGTITVKKLGITASGNYQITGQKITITVTQPPPLYSCGKMQKDITEFITGGELA